MIELRPLELKHYPTVYGWTERYPWPSELNGYEQWKEKMLNRLTAAVFLDVLGDGRLDKELIAVFSFDVLGSGVLELHFDAPPDVAGMQTLLMATLSIEKQLFEDGNAQLIVGWTPAGNRGVVQLAEGSGLKWDGVEMFKGKRRWIRLSITREQYEQQKQADEHNNPIPDRNAVGAVQQ